LQERRERRKKGRMRDAFQPTFFLLSLSSSDEKSARPIHQRAADYKSMG
jgi:hypothetical protein